MFVIFRLSQKKNPPLRLKKKVCPVEVKSGIFEVAWNFYIYYLTTTIKKGCPWVPTCSPAIWMLTEYFTLNTSNFFIIYSWFFIIFHVLMPNLHQYYSWNTESKRTEQLYYKQVVVNVNEKIDVYLLEKIDVTFGSRFELFFFCSHFKYFSE